MHTQCNSETLWKEYLTKKSTSFIGCEVTDDARHVIVYHRRNDL